MRSTPPNQSGFRSKEMRFSRSANAFPKCHFNHDQSEYGSLVRDSLLDRMLRGNDQVPIISWAVKTDTSGWIMNLQIWPPLYGTTNNCIRTQTIYSTQRRYKIIQVYSLLDVKVMANDWTQTVCEFGTTKPNQSWPCRVCRFEPNTGFQTKHRRGPTKLTTQIWSEPSMKSILGSSVRRPCFWERKKTQILQGNLSTPQRSTWGRRSRIDTVGDGCRIVFGNDALAKGATKHQLIKLIQQRIEKLRCSQHVK